MHACIMSACTMRTCTLRARTLRACTVRACTLRACKVRACTSDFKQKIRRQSDTQSINQSEWPCHFLSCLSQLKIKPKKCHKKWKKSKKAGGGDSALKIRKSKIQNVDYCEMRGVSRFSYFSHIQMAEIWPWFRWGWVIYWWDIRVCQIYKKFQKFYSKWFFCRCIE